ncbi:MAG: MBL fold metallo-hydrolase [Oscillospiraceae bacterium]|nr:MBL fold metallo-hydrolase [Oscillospiraceae bacterium]
MKKLLKWIGIIFAALIVIGMIFPSDTEDTDTLSPSITETQASTAASIAPKPDDPEPTASAETLSTTAPVTEAPSTKATSAPTKATVATTGTKQTEAVVATVPTTPTPLAKSVFTVHFIDVGQADAALVECDGHYMLIDGGNKADSNVIYSVLKKVAVPKLDIVVGTHAHEDHIGGLPGAFNYTTADLTLCPVKNYDSNAFEDFAKYATQKGGGITVPKKGDTYSLGSATVKILGVNGGSDTNDTSIVLRIEYGKTSFLFTGDAEREAEQAILSTGEDLSATVLKVGHHGSDTSTSYPFLREIMPKYAVISVGTGNSYGHPTEDTLSRLRDADVKVFRTDMQGDIFCTSDGNEVTFSVTRNAGADVFGGIGQNSTQIKPSTVPATKPTTKPTTAPVVEPVADMVWIPKTGSKYHSSSSCSNMKNPSKVTKSEAINLGYEPCKKCY